MQHKISAVVFLKKYFIFINIINGRSMFCNCAFCAYQRTKWNTSEFSFSSKYHNRWSIRFNALNSRQTFYRSAPVGLVSFERFVDRLFPYASIVSYMVTLNPYLDISVFSIRPLVGQMHLLHIALKFFTLR